jgi:capsular polysaccharide biosynthesis protein
MPSDRTTATLSDYAAIVRRRWRVVVVCTLIGLAFGALFALRSPAQYTSRASVVIRPILSDPFVDTRIEDVGADTQAKILSSTVVAKRAAALLKTDQSPEGLLRHLTVENPTGTLILNVGYTAGSPRKAQAGAQAFARAYLDHRSASAEDTKERQLAQNAAQREIAARDLDAALRTIAGTAPNSAERTNAEAQRDLALGKLADLQADAARTQGIDTDPGQIIRPAGLPSSPSSQSNLLTLLAAAILGALVGVGVAIIRDRTDPHIRTRRELVDLIGNEPLAEIPRRRTAATGLASIKAPTGPEAGAYRSLRVRLWPRRGIGPRRVLVAAVTEPAAADEVAANLAVTTTDSGWAALLAWAEATDYVTQFSVEPLPKVEVVVGESPVERMLISPPAVRGLTLLPSLAAHAEGRAAVETRVAEARLDALDERFDVEIVVGAPLLSSTASIELCPLVDSTVIVFDPAVSDRHDLERAMELLAGVGSQVAGIVCFRAPWAGGA